MDRVFKVSPKSCSICNFGLKLYVVSKRIRMHVFIPTLFCFSNYKGRNKASSETFKILHLMQISKVMTLLVVPAEDKS